MYLKLQNLMAAIFYTAVLLLNDPHMHSFYQLQSATARFSENIFLPAMRAEGRAEYIHIQYILNGGSDSGGNPVVLKRENLPYSLAIPYREGYNFAGWYTDSGRREKMDCISSAENKKIVLFAKWTAPIDNRRNVELYPYCTNSKLNQNQKKLKDCSYRFVKRLNIPGTPQTREMDFKNRYINSGGQYFQGLVLTEELVLMTAYAEETELPGSLLVFDRKSGEYLASVGMKAQSHLGGIAYDGENIWVCHSVSATIERISYSDILAVARAAPKCYVELSGPGQEYRVENKPSCLAYENGLIWVATHDRRFHAQVISYRYDERTDSLCPGDSYRLPSKVQGIAFGADGKVYLSTSFGRNNSSYLKVYRSLRAMDEKPDRPAIKVEMPPCSEEIVLENDYLYVLFESAGQKYFEGTDGRGKSNAPIDKLLEIETVSLW